MACEQGCRARGNGLGVKPALSVVRTSPTRYPPGQEREQERHSTNTLSLPAAPSLAGLERSSSKWSWAYLRGNASCRISRGMPRTASRRVECCCDRNRRSQSISPACSIGMAKRSAPEGRIKIANGRMFALELWSTNATSACDLQLTRSDTNPCFVPAIAL